MIKFVICDDTKSAMNKACNCVNKVMMRYDIDYKIIKFDGYCDELKEEITEISEPKIYILDVEMPNVSGLEIASEIREIDDDSFIVFATIHSECKDDIFFSRLEAIDYISKEYRYEDRLEETLIYILKKIYRNKSFDYTYNRIHNKLLFKEINFIEKEQLQNRCIIHLIDGDKKLISDTITNIKSKLIPLFFQSHKSCLVNLCNIKYIDYAISTIYFNNGDYTSLLSNEAKKELKKIVGDN